MKVHANMSLDPEIHDKMKEVARDNNTSVSALLTEIFLEYIRSLEEEDG